MEPNDRLTSHLLDFLYQLNRNGMKTPLTVAGGFGLFLKRRYLAEQKIRTLLDRDHKTRSTEDIDVFIRMDVLCDPQQVKVILNTLHNLNYEAEDTARYMQWKKTIDLEFQMSGHIKIDFLVGDVDAHKTQLKISKPRARNRRVEGFHAHITPEALCIDEKSQEIPIAGTLSNGNKYATIIRVPHPFTYLIMKLFAFHDRLMRGEKERSIHHAFDVFLIIAHLTEKELIEAKDLSNLYIQKSVVKKAKQIVEDRFTGRSLEGMINVKSHPLFSDYEAEDYTDFLNSLAEIFGIIQQ